VRVEVRIFTDTCEEGRLCVAVCVAVCIAVCVAVCVAIRVAVRVAVCIVNGGRKHKRLH